MSIKKIIVAASVLAVAAVTAHKVTTRQEPATNVIKIGIALPLRGEFAAAGEGMKAAAKLAEQDLNEKSQKYQYRLLIEDDGFEAKRTAAIFNKLINIDQADALISFASQGGNIAAPQAEKHKIVHINFGATDARVLAGDYNFVHWTSPQSTTRKLLDFYRRQGWNKVAVITANNAGTISLEQALVKQLQDYPQLTITRFRVQPTEKDFRMLLAEVKEIDADAVLVLVYGDSVYPFIRQFYELKINKPLTNIEAFTMLPDLSMIEGVYIADAAKGKQQLIQRLLTEKPGRSTYAAGNIYDAVMLIGEAFAKAENKQQAVEIMKNMKTYEGSVGGLRQDERGFFDSEAVLEQVQNGQLVVISD